MYYLRQSVFPFGIYNLKDNYSVIYLYHEGTEHKRLHEFLLKHIEENTLPFSDGCGGQNKKNHVFVFFCP